jgi:hypothetical protein
MAVLITHGILGSVTTRVLARLQLVFIVFNILISAATIVALPAATPAPFRNDAKNVFVCIFNLLIWFSLLWTF